MPVNFPRSPKLLKGGIVLMDSDSGAIQRVIALQYNPQSLTRTLQPQSSESQSGDRTEALRLTGPPVETIKLDAEIDATDQLEFPEQHRLTQEQGIHPQLAALEVLIYPSSQKVRDNISLAGLGTLEIVPVEAPLTIFVFGRSRIAPVRVTDLSITEEFFDPNLNPIRAKVGLGLRVLSVNDLNPNHRGSSIFMTYQKQKEKLADAVQQRDVGPLGIEGIPT